MLEIRAALDVGLSLENVTNISDRPVGRSSTPGPLARGNVRYSRAPRCSSATANATVPSSYPASSSAA